MNEEDIKLKQYLTKINCRGCYNHCPLSNPMCGRSKIFVNEAIEKFNSVSKNNEPKM